MNKFRPEEQRSGIKPNREAPDDAVAQGEKGVGPRQGERWERPFPLGRPSGLLPGYRLSTLRWTGFKVPMVQ